eukprot:10212910-Alexandrium_andersonii.AAC.1
MPAMDKDDPFATPFSLTLTSLILNKDYPEELPDKDKVLTREAFECEVAIKAASAKDTNDNATGATAEIKKFAKHILL